MPKAIMITLFITQLILCAGVLTISGVMIYKVIDDCRRRDERRARWKKVKNGGV